MIGEREIEGVGTLTLASDAVGGIEVAFAPGAGMVACSLRHRGEELLGQRGGLRRYLRERSTMGVPLLHPWANRLAADRFAIAGRAVDLSLADPPPARDANGLPIHGLLAAAGGWRVIEHAVTTDGGTLAAGFDFNAEPGWTAAFPFPHTVRIDAILAGPRLTVETAIKATGEIGVPVSFGYHPYLRLPGLDRTAWEIEVPVTERLVLDDSGLPTGIREPVSVASGRLGTRTFDDAYLAPGNGAPFVLAGGGRRVSLALGDGYPFAQVYAPSDDDVIAYEPMTAPTNSLVTGGPDLPIIEPGGQVAAEFSITVSG